MRGIGLVKDFRIKTGYLGELYEKAIKSYEEQPA